MNNPSVRNCWPGLCFGLAAVILAGAVIFPSNASAQSETRIISVSTNLDFGRIEIGDEPARGLVIANKGNSDLTISNFNLPDGFRVVPEGFGGAFTNLTVPAGGWTNVFVTFMSTNVMHYGGTATIDSDATSGKNEFTVSGEGGYPTGHYVGLFLPATNVAFDNSGYFSASASANGVFSGVLHLAGKQRRFSGHLSSTGTFSGSIAQKGGSPLGASFEIIPGTWVGTISNETWSANLTAFRMIQPREGLRLPGETSSPKYQFQIAGSTNLLLAPTNDGVGTLKFNTLRDAHLSGRLPDGTAFSQNTFFATQVPFYASLYHGRGAVLGWIRFEVVITNLPQPQTPISLTNLNLPQFTNGNPILRLPLTNIPPVLITNILPFTNFLPVTNIEVIPYVPPAEPPMLPTSTVIGPLRDELRRRHPTPVIGVPAPLEFSGTNRISGTINWFKPAGIDPNYPDGFSLETSVSGPTD